MFVKVKDNHVVNLANCDDISIDHRSVDDSRIIATFEGGTLRITLFESTKENTPKVFNYIIEGLKDGTTFINLTPSYFHNR